MSHRWRAGGELRQRSAEGEFTDGEVAQDDLQMLQTAQSVQFIHQRDNKPPSLQSLILLQQIHLRHSKLARQSQVALLECLAGQQFQRFQVNRMDARFIRILTEQRKVPQTVKVGVVEE
ncbi:hypothetical protein TYRP_017339 [Tyrophagus putrescentiae]|nr:hypothetical protein TYRP_017339 [Tyrophagus putrescentiae]